MQLSFARRLLTDFVKSRSKGYATCATSASRESNIIRCCASRLAQSHGPVHSACAFVQSDIVLCIPANLACRKGIGILSGNAKAIAVCEVSCRSVVRCGITDQLPTTSHIAFAEVSLLQLHVVYGGIIDLLWCLCNAIAFSLKKNVYSC